ncbi:uncharacterized protein LOC127104538 [Lathyrus oleraceus]|uniref:uncharacterized protein LOC127104538 n=1 Tax=Pisum sativum TaxID=3888 RepID=UPI0021CE0BCE|nr:uncharacterized protein LOC127104538 [Pisum sativum]
MLQTLKENKTYAKLSKCGFWMKEVSLSGHVISSGGIVVDPLKVDAALQWETPKSVTEIRSFLGLAGGMMMQNRQVMAYASIQLKIHERDYPTHDLQLVAVVFVLKIQRHYMFGSKFKVFSYYKSLKYLFDQKELNMRKLLHMSMPMVRELELIEQFQDLSLVCEMTHNNIRLGMLKLINGILEEIIEGKKIDLGLVDRLMSINQGKYGEFKIDENGVIRFKDRVCVPHVPVLKKSVLEKGHTSGLGIHHGATKMYQDLKKLFWWPGMKKEIVQFVYAYLTCQNPKIEHHKSLGLMQPLSIPKWKLDNISMNFVSGLPKTVKNCDTIWVVVDRLTKSIHSF